MQWNRKWQGGVLAAGLALLATAAVASAGAGGLACAAVGFGSRTAQPDGRWTEPGHGMDATAEEARLVSDARLRIAHAFGPPRSQPIVIFMPTAEVLGRWSVNAHGSTQFLAGRTCVLIGPLGRSTDVVAHELMHAEVAERVGAWRRFTEIPSWFEEGLAMQVDHRVRYDLPSDVAIDTEALRRLTTARRFNQADDETLTRRYAEAKTEVRRWLALAPAGSLYERLDRVRTGASFDAIWSGAVTIPPQ